MVFIQWSAYLEGRRELWINRWSFSIFERTVLIIVAHKALSYIIYPYIKRDIEFLRPQVINTFQTRREAWNALIWASILSGLLIGDKFWKFCYGGYYFFLTLALGMIFDWGQLSFLSGNWRKKMVINWYWRVFEFPVKLCAKLEWRNQLLWKKTAWK